MARIDGEPTGEAVADAVQSELSNPSGVVGLPVTIDLASPDAGAICQQIVNGK